MRYLDNLFKKKSKRGLITFIYLIILLVGAVSIFTYYGEKRLESNNISVGSNVMKEDKQPSLNEISESVSTMNFDKHGESEGDIFVKLMSKSPAQTVPEEDEPPANPNGKIVRITIDDGPNPILTPRVLDILKHYNVRATFFVIGNIAERNASLVQREVNEGHRVLNHTYTHDYNKLYSKPQNLIDELNKTDEVLKKIIPGYSYKIMRFPGGSFGRTEYRQAVEKAGYKYYDWNCSTGDGAAGKLPVSTYLDNIKKYSQGNNDVIVLMHDAPGKEGTVEALPKIIEYYISNGYAFDVIR